MITVMSLLLMMMQIITAINDAHYNDLFKAHSYKRRDDNDKENDADDYNKLMMIVLMKIIII